MKKTWQDYGREWLDTLVVAISVAMAFRAYFYEPFKIPTGSMQETLWGNHTTECSQVGAWQKSPLKWLNWLATGRDYKEFVASSSGSVYAIDTHDGRFTLGVQFDPSKKTISLPQDVIHKLNLGPDYAWGRPVVINERLAVIDPASKRCQEVIVRAGQKLWSGYDTTGDFIFVNRWKWNFWQPKNEDVMIFSTTGVGEIKPGDFCSGPLCKGADGKLYKLQQGTHYIKRMKARPGETYTLEHPVQGGDASVTMGPDEYFACGDNFNNSFDSRFWGPVPREKLRGEGSFVFWPFNGWRIIR